MSKKMKQEPQDQVAGTAQVVDITIQDAQTEPEEGEQEKTIAELEEEALRLKESLGDAS